MRKLILLTAMMLLVPAVSQAKTLEDLLVEKGVITKGEAAAASAGAPGSVHYAKGVRWEFSDKQVEGSLQTMIRTRYTYTDYDKDDSASPKNTSSFDVTQARLIASGSVLDKEFSYFLQGDFVGDSTDGKKSASLKDAYITYNACDWANIGMGQHKTGISRQFETSEVNLMFPDESDVSDYFNLGRQAGVWASLAAPDMPLEFSAAMYNGESDGEGVNRSGLDTNHTAIVTARWEPLGEVDELVESDIDGSEELGLSLGVAAAFSKAKNDLVAAGAPDDNDVFTLGADAIAKYQGWSFSGEYFYRNVDSDQLDEEISPTGFYAQAGYMLTSDFELAARYGFLDCDNGAASGVCAGNDSVETVDVGANYYFMGNQLKAQLAWALLNEDPEDTEASDVETDRIIFNVSGLF